MTDLASKSEIRTEDLIATWELQEVWKGSLARISYMSASSWSGMQGLLFGADGALQRPEQKPDPEMRAPRLKPYTANRLFMGGFEQQAGIRMHARHSTT